MHLKSSEHVYTCFYYQPTASIFGHQWSRVVGLARPFAALQPSEQGDSWPVGSGKSSSLKMLGIPREEWILGSHFALGVYQVCSYSHLFPWLSLPKQANHRPGSTGSTHSSTNSKDRPRPKSIAIPPFVFLDSQERIRQGYVWGANRFRQSSEWIVQWDLRSVWLAAS